MNSIKVLYSYSSAKLDTGSPRALLQMMDSLDRTRFEPIFLSAFEGPLTDAIRQRDVRVIKSEVVSVSWKKPQQLLSAIHQKMQLLREVSPGIVHLNEPGWNSDIVIAAYLEKIPVALHLHNRCEVAKSNLNFKIARRIFICSSAQRQAIAHFDKIEDKCIVLHNAIDIESFGRGRPIRREIGLNPDDIVVGTVAQIRHGKGIDILLDVAEKLLNDKRKLKFVIVGPEAPDERAYFEKVRERMSQGPLRDGVIYLGSRRDIPDLMASFDIFCLPTRGETFGIVVIEAMAAGVPVVASAVGGVPEIIDNETIGRTVGSLSADAFEHVLRELIDAEPERRAIGERGRNSLRGRFDLDHMGATLGRIYEEMTGANRHR